MKIIKKIFPFFITVVVLLSAFTVSVFADGISVDSNKVVQFEKFTTFPQGAYNLSATTSGGNQAYPYSMSLSSVTGFNRYRFYNWRQVNLQGDVTTLTGNFTSVLLICYLDIEPVKPGDTLVVELPYKVQGTNIVTNYSWDLTGYTEDYSFNYDFGSGSGTGQEFVISVNSLYSASNSLNLTKFQLSINHLLNASNNPASQSWSFYPMFGTKMDVFAGSASSPEFPNYSKPDGGELGNLENDEKELLESNQDGFDTLTNNFNNFGSNLLEFTQGMLLISSIMTAFTNGIPLMSVLLSVSLALGFAAVLLGLANSIVGAADRKAGREQRKKR